MLIPEDTELPPDYIQEWFLYMQRTRKEILLTQMKKFTV